MMHLIVEITETDLRSDLDAAGLEGISTSIALQASAEGVSDLVLFGVTLAAQVPLGLFVNWLYDQVIQRKRGTYHIHNTHISQHGTQINITINVDAQDIQDNIPQEEQKAEPHTKTPQGKRRTRRRKPS